MNYAVVSCIIMLSSIGKQRDLCKPFPHILKFGKDFQWERIQTDPQRATEFERFCKDAHSLLHSQTEAGYNLLFRIS